MIYFIFILGTILGSFYLVLATRLPKNEDIIISRSHCDSCNEILAWYQLIPIISFLIFKGKCPKCNQKIPLINLAIELFTGLLFSLMFYLYGFSYEFYTGLIISSLMIIIFISDFKFLMILDSPLIVSGISIFVLKIIYFGIIPALKSLLCGLIIFFLFYLIGLLGNKLFKKESLGGGDIKFAFLLGEILGLKLGLISIVLSSFLALPISIASLLITKNNEVPYGPFLVGSLFIVFVFMEKFTNLINLFFSL